MSHRLAKILVSFPTIEPQNKNSFSHPSAFESHCSGVNSIVADSSRYLLYSAGRDSSIRIWSYGKHELLSNNEQIAYSTTPTPQLPDPHETICIETLSDHIDWVNDIQLTQNGTKLVSCGSDYKVFVHDLSFLFSDPWRNLRSSKTSSHLFKTSSESTDAYIGSDFSSPIPKSSIKSKPFHFEPHSDFIKKINCHISSNSSEMVIFSIGLDGCLKQAVLTQNGEIRILNQFQSKHSLYSLSSCPIGVDQYLIATGGSDGVIRLYDSRIGGKSTGKLKGHDDIVKSLIIPTHTKNTILSGSSDGTIKMWDYVAMKNMKSFVIHDDSVWCLAEKPVYHEYGSSSLSDSIINPEINQEINHSIKDDNSLSFFSGGRDGRVFFTHVDSNETRLICKEPFPVLCMAPVMDTPLSSRNPQKSTLDIVDDEKNEDSLPLSGNRNVHQNDSFGLSLWVSTTNPSITNWHVDTQFIKPNLRQYESSGQTQSRENGENGEFQQNQQNQQNQSNQENIKNINNNTNTNMIDSIHNSNINTTGIHMSNEQEHSSSLLHLSSSPILPSSLLGSTLSMSPINSSSGMSSAFSNTLEVAAEQLQEVKPLLTTQQAISKTPSRPAITSHLVLNDRERVLTRDSSGRILLFNITQLRLEKDFGICESFEEVLPGLQTQVHLPNWFSCDTKLGQLSIQLEYPKCLECYHLTKEAVYHYLKYKEKKFTNIGGLFLFKIFEKWIQLKKSSSSSSQHQNNNQNNTNVVNNDNKDDKDDKDENKNKSNENDNLNNQTNQTETDSDLSQPPRLNVAITIVQEGISLVRSFIDDWEASQNLPNWITEVLFDPKKLNPQSGSKIEIFLKPKYADLPRAPLDKFNIVRSLTVAEMKEYLRSKFRNLDKDIPIIIAVNGNLEVDDTQDIGTIKHFLWKSGGPVPLTYDFEIPK